MRKSLIPILLTVTLSAIGVEQSAEHSRANSSIEYMLIVTGEELLRGLYADAHTVFIASKLRSLGLICVGSLIVSDKQEDLERALRFAAARVRLIITTGGLGPASDDITRQTIAAFTQIELRESPIVLGQIAARLNASPESLTPNVRRQAYVPVKGGWLPNDYGTAVGLIFDNQDLVVIALPGPPRELRPIVENHLIRWLSQRFGLRDTPKSITLRFAGIGESQIDHLLHTQVGLSPEISVLSLFEKGRVDVTLTIPPGVNEQVLHDVTNSAKSLLGQYLYAIGDQSLESVVLKQLKRLGIDIIIIETTTAGNLSAALCSVEEPVNPVALAIVCGSGCDLLRIFSNLSSLSTIRSLPLTKTSLEQLLIEAGKELKGTAFLVSSPTGATDLSDPTQFWVALGPVNGKVFTAVFSSTSKTQEGQQRLVTSILNWCRNCLDSLPAR